MPVQQIFSGVTTAPCRDFVAACILADKPDTVYMPCAGGFGSAQAFVNHGGERKILWSSDISLYTSILGYLYDETKDVRDLHIINNSIIQPVDDDELSIASAAILAMKYGQISISNKYSENIRAEIRRNKEKYLEQVRYKLQLLCKALGGSHYDIADMWDVINAAKDNERDCIFINVPMYKGGYERMFKDAMVEWDAPDIKQFQPSFYDDLVRILGEARCTCYLYSPKNLNHITDNWKVIYAQPYDLNRTDYVVCNRWNSKVYALSQAVNRPHKNFEIYSDEEITQQSRIEFIQVDAPTCLYYRDLFVHKLGTTKAEAYYLMLIDGRVVTALGLTMRDVFTGKSSYAGEVFGISKSSKRYKRLGKLFMMCLTSGDFKRFLQAKYQKGIHEVDGIKTSSLTTYAEGKTNRSVMKLVHREQLDNGTYRVVYIGKFRDDTWTDCLTKWLGNANWGGKKR